MKFSFVHRHCFCYLGESSKDFAVHCTLSQFGLFVLFLKSASSALLLIIIIETTAFASEKMAIRFLLIMLQFSRPPLLLALKFLFLHKLGHLVGRSSRSGMRYFVFTITKYVDTSDFIRRSL